MITNSDHKKVNFCSFTFLFFSFKTMKLTLWKGRLWEKLGDKDKVVNGSIMPKTSDTLLTPEREPIGDKLHIQPRRVCYQDITYQS